MILALNPQMKIVTMKNIKMNTNVPKKPFMVSYFDILDYNWSKNMTFWRNGQKLPKTGFWRKKWATLVVTQV